MICARNSRSNWVRRRFPAGGQLAGGEADAPNAATNIMGYRRPVKTCSLLLPLSWLTVCTFNASWPRGKDDDWDGQAEPYPDRR